MHNHPPFGWRRAFFRERRSRVFIHQEENRQAAGAAAAAALQSLFVLFVRTDPRRLIPLWTFTTAVNFLRQAAAQFQVRVKCV